MSSMSTTGAAQASPLARASWVWLAMSLLLASFVWAAMPQPELSNNSMTYSRASMMLAEGYDLPEDHVLRHSQFLWQNNPFSHHYGLLIPTAVFYKLFGVSIHTTNAIALLAFLIIMTTVWAALPDDRSRRIGLLLCLSSVPLWRASTALSPDIVATAFMAVSSLFLFTRERALYSKMHSRLVPLAAIGLLFYAFLNTLSFYWVLPLWVWAFLRDFSRPSARPLLLRFWEPAILIGLILGLGWLLINFLIWGNPWARFENFEAAKNLWSWEGASRARLIERLTTGPVDLLINLLKGWWLLAFAGLGLFVAPPRLRPWGGYLLCCLLFYWFGSTSFRSYQPLPLMSQLLMPVIPALLIFAAFAIGRLSSKAMGVLIVILISGLPLYDWIQAQWKQEIPPAEAVASIIRQTMSENPDGEYLLICAEARGCTTRLPLYFAYDYPDNLKALYVGDLKETPIQGEPVIFAYLDHKTANFLQKAYGQKHYLNELKTLPRDRLYRSGEHALFRMEVGKERLLETLFPQ